MFGLDFKSVIVGVLFALFVYPMLVQLLAGARKPVSKQA